MGLFDVFSKGGKYFGKAIEPKCEYCESGKRAKDGDKVLCAKKGLVDAGFHCPKYVYSPLKRIPEKQMNRVGFLEGDYDEKEDKDEEAKSADSAKKAAPKQKQESAPAPAETAPEAPAAAPEAPAPAAPAGGDDLAALAAMADAAEGYSPDSAAAGTASAGNVTLSDM